VFDRTESGIPVSATQIRREPHRLRQWIAPEVASDFVHRIVLLGGESSGKSTLAAALAAHYDTVWVHEYGRELWEQQNGIMSESDLLAIAQQQIRREEAASRAANGYLFCDTSPLTTAGYGLWMFGRVDPHSVRTRFSLRSGWIAARPSVSRGTACLVSRSNRHI
jgi:HTH-type transcriptional repressor of NAD biosynthesis genes